MSHRAGGLSISTTGPNQVALAGDLDAHTASEFARFFGDLDDPASDVEIDLDAVDFIDSSGLRVIIDLHRRLVETGGSLVLRRPKGIVLRLFEISGMTEFLTIRSI